MMEGKIIRDRDGTSDQFSYHFAIHHFASLFSLRLPASVRDLPFPGDGSPPEIPEVGYPPKGKTPILKVLAADSLSAHSPRLWSLAIAKSKSPTTFAKRQREQNKKRKANDKLNRRIDRKAQAEREPPPVQQTATEDVQEG